MVQDLALCYSSTEGIAEFDCSSTNLTPNSCGIFQLAKLLPPNRRWHLILDNNFTNVPRLKS